MNETTGATKSAIEAFVAVAVSVLFVGTLCGFLHPRWETNDDVAMSMVAHGYGIADHGAPTLIFSNVVWGAIVRSLPNIGGLLGYSVGTFGCLLLAGAAMAWLLRRLDAPWVLALLGMMLVLSRAVLVPQFTMNAGIAAATSLVAMLAYARTASVAALVLGCCFAVLAFVVRDLEFALLGLVALPCLPWSKIRDRGMLLAALAVVACIAGSWTINHLAYAGPEWAYYFELNWPRALFTDFGAGGQLVQRPDILAKYGWSTNDVQLISNWFFVDKSLADPSTMSRIIDDLSIAQGGLWSHAGGVASLATVFKPTLLPLAATGLALLLLKPRMRLLGPWVLCIVIMYAMGAFGRQGVSRVYVPIFCLLILLPLTQAAFHRGWRSVVATVILAAGVVFQGSNLLRIDGVAKALPHLAFKSEQATAVWGAAFPFETVYPPFIPASQVSDTRMYPLGVFTFAPFSVAFADEAKGLGFIPRLQSAEGLPIIAFPPLLDMLKVYCREHLKAALSAEDRSAGSAWTLQIVRCVRSP